MLFAIPVTMIVIFFLKVSCKKNDDVNLKIYFNTDEEYLSATYGCNKFIDRYRFLSMGLNERVKTLDNDVFETLKKEFPDKWEYLKKIRVFIRIFQ